MQHCSILLFNLRALWNYHASAILAGVPAIRGLDSTTSTKSCRSIAIFKVPCLLATTTFLVAMILRDISHTLALVAIVTMVDGQSLRPVMSIPRQLALRAGVYGGYTLSSSTCPSGTQRCTGLLSSGCCPASQTCHQNLGYVYCCPDGKACSNAGMQRLPNAT